MKKILFMLLISAALLCSCGKFDPTDYPWELVESEVIPCSENDYSLEIIDGTLTNTGCNVFISKNTGSDDQLVCGGDFYIELLGDKWYRIKPFTQYYTFPEAGWVLNCDNLSKEQVADWSELYGELPAETYRIVKNIRIMTSELGVFKEDVFTYLSAEFVIE